MSKKKLKKQIFDLLKSLKINKGDNVIIHSNLAGIYQFYKKFNNKSTNFFFLKTLTQYIGKQGTLLVPSYNFDFTKGKTYDRSKSISHVGSFGTFLIEKFYKQRTFEPTFSHFVFGRLKKEVFNCQINEAFGQNSIFKLIQKNNFKILCFCCSPARMTFLHYIEKESKVSYRFNKYFNSKIKFNNVEKKIKFKYYAGKKKIDYTIKEKNILKCLKNNLEISNFGRFSSSSISARKLYFIIKKKLENNNYSLIE